MVESITSVTKLKLTVTKLELNRLKPNFFIFFQLLKRLPVAEQRGKSRCRVLYLYYIYIRIYRKIDVVFAGGPEFGLRYIPTSLERTCSYICTTRLGKHDVGIRIYNINLVVCSAAGRLADFVDPLCLLGAM